MGFVAVCTALFDYTPQAEGELPLREGELVYILEKSTEDDWWKAKKKAASNEDDEPVGLIPNNYVETAQPAHSAKALYDYSRQTDEELSFSEDSTLFVYDTSDPDWTLVGLDDEYGFAPANYIEVSKNAEAAEPNTGATTPPLPTRPPATTASSPPTQAVDDATSVQQKLAQSLQARAPPARDEMDISPEAQPGAVEEENEEEPPPPMLPRRPPTEPSPEPLPPPVAPPLPATVSSPPPAARAPAPVNVAASRSFDSGGVQESPPINRAMRHHSNAHGTPQRGGYRLYNINEMVAVFGKQKKMPTTLGINLAAGLILVMPEKKADGPQQEWSADKLTHYSIEGKHVFLELVKPSRSIDFHAGAKDTAMEIVSALGELAGMYRAEGLREVIAAGEQGRSRKKGHMLYEFMAQGDDEVTVAENDEVIILDDQQSEEWWKVRRLRNGKEGVVPSSYVEVTGTTSPAPAATPTTSFTNAHAGQSIVEQNRREEERLTREALRDAQRRAEEEEAQRQQQQRHQQARNSEVGPGLRLPNRASSLMSRPDDAHSSSQPRRSESRSDHKQSSAKSKPDMSKVRVWTDRSASFKVEAQFIGLKDNQIHLHKLNGVKIRVPVAKMSTGDLEYVKKITGVSLDDDKPLSDLKAQSGKAVNGTDRKHSTTAGATVRDPNAKPEYDWFDFFLKCGVNPYHCERYASNFSRDSMDEAILPDITPSVLRNLGLKEGDILRVTKYIDTKYGRNGGKSKLRNVSFGGEEVMGKDDGEETPQSAGGLFSGPGGTLRNNTRKSRPAPPVQTDNVVDSKAFRQHNHEKSESSGDSKAVPDSPPAPAPPRKDDKHGGFDDDAWNVKPVKAAATQIPPPKPTSPAPAPAPATAPSKSPPPPVQPQMTGAMAELSLLSEPLKPVVTHSTGVKTPQSAPAMSTAPNLVPQPTALPQQPQSNAYQFQQQPTSGIQQSLQSPVQQQPQPLQAPPQTQGQASPSMLQPTHAQMPFGPAPPFYNPVGSQATGAGLPSSVQGLSQQPTGLSLGATGIGSGPRQRPSAPPFSPQGPIPPPPRPLSAPQNASNPNNFAPPPLQPQLTGAAPGGQFQQNSLASPPPQSLSDLNRMRLQQQMGQYPQQQQQQQPLGQQSTGFPGGFPSMSNGLAPQATGSFAQTGPLQPQSTGFNPQQQSPFLLGQQPGSPFADPRFNSLQPQNTGFQGAMQPQNTGFPGSMQSQNTGFSSPFMNMNPATGQPSGSGPGALGPQQTGSINQFLPPALQPQATGINGANGTNYSPSFNGPQQQQQQQQQPQQQAPALQPQFTAIQPQATAVRQPSVAPLQPQKTGPAPPVRFGIGNTAPKLMPQATGRRANLSQATPDNPFGF